MHLPADMAIAGRDREQAELATALTSARPDNASPELTPPYRGRRR
jgi:hypothetical protein